MWIALLLVAGASLSITIGRFLGLVVKKPGMIVMRLSLWALG